MDLIIRPPNSALWGAAKFRCAIGRNGIIEAESKREGDGKTPAGRWAMREVFYRPDRVAKPETSLPVRELEPRDGWCDAPGDPNYNKLIQHPYTASAEHLWRDDHLYDYVIVLGHNDHPVKPGLGSAIFFHVASEGFRPSAGCVTLEARDLRTVLREANRNSHVQVLAT